MWRFLILLTLASASAHAAPLRIQGTSHFSAIAVVLADPKHLEIGGRLLDERGNPISGVSIGIRSGAIQPCRISASVMTDGDGRFCLRLDAVKETERDVLVFGGSEYQAATHRELSLNPGHVDLDLHFPPGPLTIALGGASTEVSLGIGNSAITPRPAGLQIHFEPEGGSQQIRVGTAKLAQGQILKCLLHLSGVAHPGSGRLIARLQSGSSQAHANTPVLFTAVAALKTAVPGGSHDASEGIPISVEVASLRGPVPNGWVEARFRDLPVGMASVIAGRAKVIVSFSSPREEIISLKLQYLPAEPAWLPPAPTTVSLSVQPPSLWRRLPWLLAVCAILSWVVRGWWRPAASKRRASPAPAHRGGPPTVAVITEAPGTGWQGRVLDVHDGRPLGNVVVEVHAATFGTEAHNQLARTDSNGRFTIASVAVTSSDSLRLVARARWHATLEQIAPPQGVIELTLASRRRSLLSSLTSWSERMGVPWVNPGDATPSEVRATAEGRGDAHIARWASAIEESGFGHDTVDEQRELAVRAQQPGTQPAGEVELPDD